jgi:hypothetical protein
VTAQHTPSVGLLIRLWLEPGAAEPVRARLLSVGSDGDPVTRSTAAGEAAVLAALAGWVHTELADLAHRGAEAR